MAKKDSSPAGKLELNLPFALYLVVNSHKNNLKKTI